MTHRCQFILLLVISALAVSAHGTAYYVSPTGNDDSSGLSQTAAWATIDNGDSKHLVAPGDTVNILPGTYLISNGIELKTAGTVSAPIVYRGYGGRPAFDAQSGNFPIITLSESFVWIEGLEILSSRNVGIHIKGDSCVVARCIVRDVAFNGIDLEGTGNRVERSLLLNAGQAGVHIKKGAVFSAIQGNTIDSANTGVDIQVNENTARIVNNIIVSCNHGISGVAGNICAYNLFWNNSPGDYFGGVVDSAGAIYQDPLFINESAADFRLGFGSPAIDAGIDVGYEFSGPAPDIGAFETGELDHLEILPVRDTLNADSNYQFIVLAYDSANNPASYGLLTWSHTFGTGSINSGGLFTPNQVGSGTISVTSSLNSVTATTGSMYVRPGVPIAVTVIPDNLTISSGDSHLFVATGIDKNANAVLELGAITWSLIGDIGSIDSTGLFSATKTGVGIISAHSSLGPDDQSDTIRVSPGPLAVLDVLPSTNVVPTLQTYQYAALGFDALSNFIADFTDSATWSTTDLIGNIDGGGMYTAGLVGSYWVKATYGGVRDSGAVDVTLGGGLDHIVIEFFDGTPVGNLTVTTDDDTTQLYARGYSAASELIGDVPVTWSILGSDSVGDLTPTIGAQTELSLCQPGAIKVVASHSGGFADTTGGITVSAGEAVSLQVFPDTATIQSGDTLRFTTTARDADGNLANPQPIPVWSVLGGIGTLIDEGLFEAQYAGHGRVIATAGGMVDSSGLIVVVAGPLVSIRVEPDTVAVRIGDTVLFTAIGLDSLGNTTDPGVVSWKALGRIGAIDATGRYVATAPGVGAVSVSNLTAGIADTTASLRVEELYLSTIAIGNGVIHPGGDEAPVAAFRIDNFYSVGKTVTSISVRDLSSGAGTEDELVSNMAKARIYTDRDHDSTLSAADSLLVETEYAKQVMDFDIPLMDIPADSGITFIVTALSAPMARDGDTVDVVLVPSADITTSDFTEIAGPLLSNSLGITQVDGMVAQQIAIIATGSRTIQPTESLQLCMAFDVPRNGYRSDTLTRLAVVNSGTASESDFDSLVFFRDDGDGQWDGPSADVFLGRLVFDGGSWSRGGLSVSLTDTNTRLFVASKLDQFPADSATVILSIPVGGVQVNSGNDGPIDRPAPSPDTLMIEGRQAIVTSVVSLPARLCVPGENTGPLLAIQFINEYPRSIAIDSCRFAFVGTDPQGASAAQLEAQVDSVYLYLDRDADAGTISAADSLFAASLMRDGEVQFACNVLSIGGNGADATLVVSAKLGLRTCKNGNTLKFTLADASSVKFDQPVVLSGTFPVQNPAPFTINAFPSAAVVTHALSGGSLYAGQVDQPVLDFSLPRNGYAGDKLSRLDLVNPGTLSESQVLETVRLWKDVTGNGFSPDDIAIGDFVSNLSGWRLENIKAALDSSLNRFVVTVSVSGKQFDGGTLRFDLPVLGVLTASGMTGPDDLAVVNPSSFLVFPSNRVTAISIPLASMPVEPGSSGHTLMTFALYNGYIGQAKTLSQITLTNSSYSVASGAFADHELGQVSLYLDANDNRILDNDRFIGTGLFTDGKLRFDGFAASLPSEALEYFFVTANLPMDLIDGDSLMVSIEQPTDFSFTDFVNLNGDLPLTSGRRLAIDGSIRGQYEVFGPAGRSLSPGDSGAVVLAFSPAYNGDQQDWLNEIIVNNLGTAGSAVYSKLELWHDVDADNRLNIGDSSLGLFAYQGGSWRISSLDLAVSNPSPRLFVVGDISTSATPLTTIRMAVPELGCTFQSGNDGPVDSSLVAPGVSTISTSGLRVNLAPILNGYSVGQTIDIAFTIKNVSGGTVDSVYGALVGISDTTLVRLDSSTVGPVSLAPGGEQIYHYFFTALGEGTESWKFRAISRVPVDSSATIQTPTTTIQRAISPVAPLLLSTSPTAVTKGQTNIFPLTIGCVHPDTGSAVAAMLLQTLRLRVVDGQGSAIAANSVFSRMVIATGYEILSVQSVIPTQSDILFTFGSPVTITPGSTQSVMLIVDIAADASAGNFRISIDSAAWLPLVDINTGQIIPTATSVIYPLVTTSTRVDSPSQQIAVSAGSCARPTVNLGQQDAGILKLLVRHSGQAGTSAVQITQLSLEVVDSVGATVSATEIFDRISLWRQSYLIGGTLPSLEDSTRIDIPFATPLNLSAQELDSIVVAVSVRPSASVAGFSLRIVDSSQFTVRDLNTGSALLAVSDTTLATGSIFPIVSAWSALRLPAEAPSVCLSNVAPASVARGADSVRLLAVSMAYDASPQHSSVRMTRVNLRIVDGNNGPIDPDQLFDRVGIRMAGGPIQYNQQMTIVAGVLRLNVADSGILMSPGDSIAVELIGDLRAEAPYASLAVQVSGIDDIDAFDVSDPNRAIGVVTASQCGQFFPFESAPTAILLPAGRPTASRSTLPVQIASAGSQQVVLFDGALNYNSTSPLGDLEVLAFDATMSRRVSSGGSADPISTSVSRVSLEIDGTVVGTDSTLTGDSVALMVTNPITLARGETLQLRVICDLTQSAEPGNILMAFSDSAFLNIIDKSLATPVYPILSGSTFPATVGEISIIAADLKTSFTNYPNPFNPARGEATTVGFVLTENATVDIDLFTVTGESVCRIADRSYRLAGAHQSDSWMGVNGEGRAVVPGVYFCRIIATYDSGRVETFKRKVAVVR